MPDLNYSDCRERLYFHSSDERCGEMKDFVLYKSSFETWRYSCNCVN